jgi:2-C-methyl-D-erythritol 4-phosphate cytidylyltransferase
VAPAVPHPFAAAVVVAAGSGTRLGGTGNKAYLQLAGRPLVAWALRTCAEVPAIGRLLLVIRPQDREQAERTMRGEVPAPVELVHGGATRHESEYHALKHLRPEIRAGEIEVVAIHDGARPLAGIRLFAETLEVARRNGAAVPGIPLDDAVAADPDGGAVLPTGSHRLVRVQTPQAFRAGPLLDAYERAAADGFTGTDTAACVERYGGPAVRWVRGDPRNVKVTYPQDLMLAERLLLMRAGEAPP